MGKLYVSRRDAKDDKDNNLMVSKRDFDAVDEITKLPKMVMER